MNRICVYIIDQILDLLGPDGTLIRRYKVSTSGKGVGEINGSFRTPRGRHVIRAKIGAGQPPNTVFIERRPSGETYSPEFAATTGRRDWILTRILWLSGCEPGFNRLREVDTMRRCIYIHGSPDSVVMGRPGSMGCIRMHNHDVIDLFDRVNPGTPIEILDGAMPA